MRELSEKMVRRARGLRNAFGATQALDGQELEIAESEIHGLAGKESWKSTLLKILA